MTRCCFFLFFLFGLVHAQPLLVYKADSLLGLGEWEAAQQLLETGLKKNPQQDTTRAWLLHRLGGVLYYGYEYEGASARLKQAWELRKSILPAGHPLLAQTAYMQGVIALVQGKFSVAEKKLQGASHIWETQSPAPTEDLADVYQLLGKLYSQTGDFGRADLFFAKALELWKALYGEGPEVADLFLLRSSLYDRMGKSRDALGDLRNAAFIFEKTQDTYYELSLAHCWQNIGLAYGNLVQYDSALFFLQQAERGYGQIAVEWGDTEARKALFDNWDNQGILLRKKGELAAAEKYNLRALDSLKGFYETPHPDLAPTYDNLGDLAAEQGKSEEAFRHYAAGLACLQLSHQQWADPALAAKLWFGKARAAGLIGWADSALLAVQVTDSLLRYLSETYLEDSARHFLTAHYLELYELGVKASRDLKDDAAAFYCMGAGRAALLRRAVSRSQAAVALGIPDSLRREVRMLQAELAMAGQEGRLELLSRLRKLGRYMDQQYPAFAAFREPRLPSLAQFQEKLARDEVALVCFWGEKQVYVLETSREETSWHSDPAGAVEAALQQLLSGQEDPGSSLSDLRAEGLAFLRDVLPLDQIIRGYKRLLVLPDGPLARLSWAGLPHPEGGWMVERIAIRTASAVDMAFEVERGAKQAEGLYAVAPHYPAQGRWPDLPMARATALAAAQLLSGRADTGSHATLAHFYEFAPQAELLHIGAHGLLSDSHPLEGGIELSDGMLKVADVYALELPARLAVLTACHSGGGQRQRGEGILSLARAFAHAGCRSLLSSLWEASADATAEISVAFYEQIKAGKPQYLALQQAQIQYLRQAPPERRHPYYWAGLTLTGAAGKQETRGYGWWGAGVLLLLGIVALVYSRRRNKD